MPQKLYLILQDISTKYMTNKAKGIVFASIAAFMWAFLAIALKVMVVDIEPSTIVWARFTIAFTILSVFYLLKRPSALKIIARPPLKSVIAGAALGLNYVAFVYGIKNTTPNIAQILVQTGPLFFTIAGILIFKERFSRTQIIGLGVAVTGFYIFYKYQLDSFNEDHEVFDLGVFSVIFAGLVWSVYASLQKILVRKIDAQELNLIIYGVPMLGFLPLVNWKSFDGLGTGGCILLIYLGLNTLLAYGSISAAIKYLEASMVSIIITLNPVITFGLTAMLNVFNISWATKENFNVFIIIGAVLVLAGAIVTIAPSKKKKLKT